MIRRALAFLTVAATAGTVQALLHPHLGWSRKTLAIPRRLQMLADDRQADTTEMAVFAKG